MSQHRVHLVLAAVLLVSRAARQGPRRAQAPSHGYCVAGHGCYRVLASGAGYRECGVASWYGRGDAGRPSAGGAPYDPNAMRVAHKTLPFGTWVRIRNLRNGREAVAMVNDRGLSTRVVSSMGRPPLRSGWISTVRVRRVCR